LSHSLIKGTVLRFYMHFSLIIIMMTYIKWHGKVWARNSMQIDLSKTITKSKAGLRHNLVQASESRPICFSFSFLALLSQPYLTCTSQFQDGSQWHQTLFPAKFSSLKESSYLSILSKSLWCWVGHTQAKKSAIFLPRSHNASLNGK
jgi:hypothetical protein